MASRETIKGVPVTEGQIAEWVPEAKAGYDVAALKKRGRGRPGRGAQPSQVVAIRFTPEELEELDDDSPARQLRLGFDTKGVFWKPSFSSSTAATSW